MKHTHFVETDWQIQEAMIHEVTNVQMLSLHQDFSTVTGEKLIVVNLAKAP